MKGPPGDPGYFLAAVSPSSVRDDVSRAGLCWMTPWCMCIHSGIQTRPDEGGWGPFQGRVTHAWLASFVVARPRARARRAGSSQGLVHPTYMWCIPYYTVDYELVPGKGP